MNAPERRGRIAEGERIHAGKLRIFRDGTWEEADGDKVFADRRIIVFGLPGAFTPTCSSQHLPRFNELAPRLRELGVDDILCVSVNDPYVMEAWARDQEADGDRADQIHDDEAQRPHGQRSWSLMIARGPALRKNR